MNKSESESESESESQWESQNGWGGESELKKMVFIVASIQWENYPNICTRHTHIVKVEYECENGCECENANTGIQRTESIIINNNYNAQCNINGGNLTEKY